ncbi:MAG: hypothetical protein HY673_01610 [Chloroflexi bacterium]|nr:hypothetical protein [Chloroflexota bacterium]
MTDHRKGLRDYQQAMIDAYYDAWMHRVLDPLYEAFQQWKRGDLPHDALTELIHEVHRENQKAYSFFTQSRNEIIACIKMDGDWFAPWLAANPPPPGVEL